MTEYALTDADGTVRWRGTIDPPPGGGSQPFLDLGTTTYADLIADGPKTIYTPTGTDFFALYFGAGCISIAPSAWRITVEPLNTTAADSFAGSRVFFADTTGSSQDQFFVAGTNDLVPGLWLVSEPVILYLARSDNKLRSAIGTWAANHVYALGATVLDSNGDVEVVTAAGTSGGSEPTWETDTFAETTDNSVTWTNLGTPPTAGSVDLVAIAGSPVAP